VEFANISQMQAEPHSPEIGISLGERVPAEAMRSIACRLQLQHFKWDTHVGDSSVLSPEPVLIAEKEWKWLCMKAENAAQEMFAFERELACSPELQRIIGVPRPLQKLFRPSEDQKNLRTLRFDFHPTVAGWVISEVNSDVPGGFGEATFLPVLFEPYRGKAAAPMTPLRLWANAAELHFDKGHIALLHAPGYLEDQQVVRVLGGELRTHGSTPHLIQSPEALQWRNGCACLARDKSIRIEAVIRFFQAEWLAKLPVRTGWQELFNGCTSTRVSNPLESVLSESKRLPLIFDHFTASSRTWRELFPACCDPREISESTREDWVLKAAYSNTGDAVHLGSDMSKEAWAHLLRTAQRNPLNWVAQRRFETVTLQSLRGPVRPCVGVFVIGDRAAGAYVRLSANQVTDGQAMEAAMFVVPEERR
jgi:glutathionylspermidine synthase